jgi:hypothetical protein
MFDGFCCFGLVGFLLFDETNESGLLVLCRINTLTLHVVSFEEYMLDARHVY